MTEDLYEPPKTKRDPLHWKITGGTVTSCATCAAPLVWVKTTNDKWMPVDLRFLKEDPHRPGLWGGESHFGHCPQSKEHSRRGR